MGLFLKRVEIATGSPDRDGLLIYDCDELVAILVRLSELHEARAGSWYLEYGPAFRKVPPVFDNLDHAVTWLEGTQRR